MEKTLYYFTDDALNFFKSNQDLIVQKMKENPDNTDWIEKVFKDAMKPSSYSFDFEFPDYDGTVSNKEDFELAKSLYELFEQKGLGPATIFSEKFATGFIFTYGYKYFMDSVGVDKNSHVFGMLFYNEGIRRATTRNIVTRLYRYIQQTVEEDKEDKYELSKYVFENTHLFRTTYYPCFDGETTHKGLFKAVKEWEEEHEGKKPKFNVQKLIAHLSILCNVNETDLMNQREIIDYVKDFIDQYNK